MIGMKALPYPGGIETVVAELGSRLVDRGHSVTAYVRPRFAQQDGNSYRGIKLVRTPSLPGKNFDTFSYAALATIAATVSRADIVHFHATGVSTFSLLPRLVGKRSIVQSHGLDWQRAKWGTLAKAYLKATEYCTVHFPDVSRKLQNHYQQRFARSAVYIPNGVTRVIATPPAQIRTLGLNGDDYILFLSRLVPEKGCHYLLDAFDRLPRSGKKLVIAGDSHDKDGYAQELKRGAREDVLFLGFVSGCLLEELLGNCYLYVLPSEIEGLSTSLLEAISYGRCVLVSDIEENVEVEGGAGYRFRSGDAKDLAQKLQYLIDCPEAVQAGRDRSHSRARELHDWDLVTDQYEALYRGLASR
jgi:glycosyltransferase involved in cell wall biosynthesis